MKRQVFKTVCFLSLLFLGSFFLLPSNANIIPKFEETVPSSSSQREYAAEQGAYESSQEKPLFSGSQESDSPQYAPAEVLVKFEEGVDPQKVLDAAGIQARSVGRIHPIEPAVKEFRKTYELKRDSKGWYSFYGKQYEEVEDIPDEELFDEAYEGMGSVEQSLYRSYKVKLTEETSVQEAVAKLEDSAGVEYAEPNYISRAFYKPNDPYYNEQWAHQNTSAEKGWNIQRGKASVAIAVIDTGVDYNHEDLKKNIWKDANSKPGRDFVDIDTKEYKKDGYALISEEDYTDIDSKPTDYNGHGTHCAGVVAAVAGNSTGVAGVANKCKVMPVRAGFSIIHPLWGETGIFEDDDIANAIRYAADSGAQTISMSFGGPIPALIVRDAIDYAYSKGVVLIAAAGNDNTDELSYPAAHNKVIAVSATDKNDQKASFSNYGDWIDVSAPGSYILSTIPETDDGYKYAFMWGTSMACPYVAGLAGLIISERPGSTNAEVYTLLRDNTDDIGNPAIGTGRVNVRKTCKAARDLPAIITATITNPSADQIVDKLITIEGTANATAFSRYSVEVGEGTSPSQWMDQGITLNNNGNKEVSSGLLATWNPLSYSSGTHTIRLKVFDGSGQSKEAKVRVEVSLPPPMQQGWPRNIAPDGSVPNTGVGSPIMADIDGDGDLEIITSTQQGYVYVWHHDGELADGWPIDIERNPKTPAAADLDGDGYMEIVVGGSSSLPLHVLNYYGTPYSGAWPKQEGINYITTAPTLADIAGDQDLEILVGNESRELCAWYANGEPVEGWPVKVEYSQQITTPAVADIDGDGKSDVLTIDNQKDLKIVQDDLK